MITVSVEIECDAEVGEDYCPAAVVVARDGCGWDVGAYVRDQLAQRGWVQRDGQVRCPLHKKS